MKFQKILLITLLLFTASIFSFSNELKVEGKNNFKFMTHLKGATSSDFSNIQNKIVKYSTRGKRSPGFTAMGVIGTIMFIVSFIFIIVGSAFLALYFLQPPLFLLAAYLSNTLLNYFIGGIVCTIVGGLLFVTGLPLMIIGFTIASRRKRRTSMMIDADIDKGLFYSGLSIKFN